MNKKTTFLLCAIFLCSTLGWGQARTVTEAMSIAESFLASTEATSLRAAIGDTPLSVAYTSKSALRSMPEKNNFYVFNRGGNNGFIIVSADARTKEVLGYSGSGTFDYNRLPPNLMGWLAFYEQEIESLDNPQPYTTPTDVQNLPAPSLRASYPASVSPLIETKWAQREPYNLKCPSNSPTGCVATAMAQIMYYHQHPVQGTGSHAYTTTTNGYKLSANFGETTYDWANMLTGYDETATDAQKDAVATLMFHCGVAVNMNYTADGSGASFYVVKERMQNYFGYTGMVELNKDAWSNATWINILKNELSSARPVIYNGWMRAGDYPYPHLFVCDGYDRSDKFHFNWGWGGDGDGFFELSALYDKDAFLSSNGQAMVIGIQPVSGDMNPDAPFLSVSTEELAFGKAAENDFFTITSNINWTVSYPAGWLRVAPSSGSNNRTVLVTAFPNISTVQRTATLTINGSGVATRTIQVTQAPSTLSSTFHNGVLTISTLKEEGEAMPDFILNDYMMSPWNARSDISTIVINDKVTSIGSGAFNLCSAVTSVTIPNSVTSIGRSAFANCTGLPAIVIPNSVTTIDAEAFMNCKNLVSVMLGNSLTTIGTSAFRRTALTSITIPVSVTKIDGGAFADCSLRDVTVEWATPLSIRSSDNIFNTPVNKATLHVPAGARTLYQQAEVWKNFGTIVEYSPVGNEAIKAPGAKPALQAYASNGILYVSGLQAGKPLNVYNLAGQLVYTGVAKAAELQLALPGVGVYIVVSGGQTVKVV